jgi:hypothetical protein
MITTLPLSDDMVSSRWTVVGGILFEYGVPSRLTVNMQDNILHHVYIITKCVILKKYYAL